MKSEFEASLWVLAAYGIGVTVASLLEGPALPKIIGGWTVFIVVAAVGGARRLKGGAR